MSILQLFTSLAKVSFAKTFDVKLKLHMMQVHYSAPVLRVEYCAQFVFLLVHVHKIFQRILNLLKKIKLAKRDRFRFQMEFFCTD